MTVSQAPTHTTAASGAQRVHPPFGKRTRVLSVTSGKGGVGKTTISTGLGLALVRQGFSVLLLDADLGLANVNVMLGFKPQKSIHDVLQGTAHIQDVIVQHDSGIDIIPATSGIQNMTLLSEVEKHVLLSAFDTLYAKYDYVLVDTAAGIGSNVQYFNAAAERVLVVVDPEPTSLTDAYAVIKVLSQHMGIDEFDVIVNRSRTVDGGNQIFRKLVLATNRFLNVKLHHLGTIQLDDAVPEAIMRQIPVLSLYPSTRASRDISRIARAVQQQGPSRSLRGGLQFFFESMLQEPPL